MTITMGTQTQSYEKLNLELNYGPVIKTGKKVLK